MRLPTVCFATCCWERDWRSILQGEGYLAQRQIANHLFPFAEKMLVINNVNDLVCCSNAAQKKIKEGVLTRVVIAEKIAAELLRHFRLKREDFRTVPGALLSEHADNDWVYYNALGPLAAIYSCRSDYLLYLTGDVRLDEPLDWIAPALQMMEKEPRYIVANPTWNHRYGEAKRESIGRKRGFYISDRGFSDQMFLVRKDNFFAPIYQEIREDSSHYPRGDLFEKRVFSAMRNRGWLRLTYAKGSYIHENF